MRLFGQFLCQFAIVFLMLASLNSCLVGPDFKRPPLPAVRHYTDPPNFHRTAGVSGKAGRAQYLIPTASVSKQWWCSFHSQKLTALVSRGLMHSPTLAAAKAALRVAQENLNAEVGNLFPAFTVQVSAQRGSAAGGSNVSSGSGVGASSFIPTGNVFKLLNASVNVAYMFDIFGGLRREIEALKAQMNYQYFEWEAAYLSLTGSIVTSAIVVASLQTQIRITQALIREQEEQLHIIRQQFTLGGVSSADVLAQETQVAQTRATLPPLEKNRELTRHTLAALVGSSPAGSEIPSLELRELDLPVCLPLGVPSLLVRHRPDVLAAEALWAAASAQVGVATANLYPQFVITGSYGRSNTTFSQFFVSQSKLWNLGGTLLQPLFKGGTLIAQRRAAIAAYEQAGAQYQQVVLQAFKNVADVLRALEADARTVRAERQAELASYANLNLIRQQFLLGGVNYLALLDAQRQYQQTRLSLVQAQANRYIDTVALYQALGGGDWHA